ncbi:Gfo/Idh/MocA family protein [Inquilinus sp.]|uniref:Gfo/Idh/MocA family protein n=1 Tax=Inquilinus sp. TaxID=1932117 RepID=UPI003784EF12
MKRTRTAVIGAGYFGSLHAAKHAELAEAELVAVCDTDPARAGALATKLGVRAVTDLSELIGQVDAVSVAVPTNAHFDTARTCLEAGIHVLIEKPISNTLEEADALSRLAADRKLVLQVGHLERFNPVVQGLAKILDRPRYIECQRISAFKPRGTDVNVVLDMMIHDIDLVLKIVGAPLDRIDAVGAPVLSEADDIVNARLQFANGCTATVTASRVSWKRHRTMRIFQQDGYIMVDLSEAKLTFIRKTRGRDGQPELYQEEQQFETGDPLKLEIQSFLDSVGNGRPPAVSGPEGRAALAAALDITHQLADWRRRFEGGDAAAN